MEMVQNILDIEGIQYHFEEKTAMSTIRYFEMMISMLSPALSQKDGEVDVNIEALLSVIGKPELSEVKSFLMKGIRVVEHVNAKLLNSDADMNSHFKGERIGDYYPVLVHSAKLVFLPLLNGMSPLMNAMKGLAAR